MGISSHAAMTALNSPLRSAPSVCMRHKRDMAANSSVESTPANRHHVRGRAVHRLPRLCAADRDDDRRHVAARRCPDHDHRLRQYPGERQADPLAHAAAPWRRGRARGILDRRNIRAAVDRHPGAFAFALAGVFRAGERGSAADGDVPATGGGRPLVAVHHQERTLVLPAALPGAPAVQRDRADPDPGGADVRLRLARPADPVDADRMGVALQHRLDVRARRRPTAERALRRLPDRAAGKEHAHREPNASAARDVVTGAPRMDYRKKFVVEPGAKVRLSKIDASYTGKDETHEKALPKIQKHVERMDKLQYLLYADGNQSLLVVLQALDAAGKDGVIRHVFSGMNPQGTSVFGFKQPSKDEAAHDFLWRAHKRVPGKGEVAIFNRSHYEDVLVVRVHKLVAHSVWSRRYDLINDFEAILTVNGTTILKFFLHISPEEQLARFKQRLDDPSRHWKISESDYSERELWPQYVEAYEDAMALTSTKHAPWYIIPSNHKWFRNLAISQIVAETMEGMNLKLPPTRVDIKDIRRKYHSAKKEEEAHGKHRAHSWRPGS